MKNRKILTKLMLFLYFIFFTTQNRIQLPGHTEFLEKMVQFIIDREMTNMFYRFGSRLVVLDGTDVATKLLEIISDRSPISTIITNINEPYMEQKFNPSIAYLLLEDEHELKTAIEHARNCKVHQPTIPTVMIILSQVNDEKQFDVVSVMKAAWNMGLYRFLLIYNDGNFNSISYNPFTSTITNLSDKTDASLFPRYINNLNGYTWKVSLFEEWPLLLKTPKNPKGEWTGWDFILLGLIARLMNATFKVVEPSLNTGFAGATQDVLDGKADFCCVRRFYVSKRANLRPVNTGSSSSLSVIVRKPSNHKKPTVVFHVFRKEIWVCLLLTITILLTTMRFFLTKQSDPYGAPNVFLDIWRILLSTPLETSVKYKYNSMIPLVTWMWASLVLNASFQCRLIDLMSYPEQERGIVNLEDLENSNLPVYSTLDYVKMQGEKGYLRHQMHLVSHKELLEKLDDPYSDCAVAMPFVSTRGKTNLEFQKYLDSRQKTVLSESLVRSYAVYTFPEFSPFSRAIYKAILQQSEYGFLGRLEQSKERKDKLERDTTYTFKLNLKHVVSAFHFLCIGLLLSLATFITELSQAKGKSRFHRVFNFGR